MTGTGALCGTRMASGLLHAASRILLLSCFLLASCGKEPLYQEQGYVFGTLVEVSVYGEDEARARAGIADVMHEFQRLHDQLHAWQPSELSRLNDAIAAGRSLVVSKPLAQMLQDAAAVETQSGGLFNPAIGRLIRLWGFQADEFKPVAPDATKIAALVALHPGMSDLSFADAPDGVRVASRNPAVQIDLGGYAKGYALDRAAALLRARGVNNALINIGGNILAIGQPGRRPWRVGIQHPRKSGALAVLELHDQEAIGTSGDYQRFFMLDGKRYCHLIDPGTGYPAQGVEAVTIMTHGPHAGVLSDAASKPLFIGGVAGWRAAAVKMNLNEAMLVDADGKIHLTDGLRKRLEFTDNKQQPE